MCCPNCGKRIKKDQTVCPWCGASQDAAKAEKKKEPVQVHLSAKGATKRKKLTPKQKKWLIGILAGVGAVVLALIVVAVSFFSSLFGRIQRESELSEGEIAVNSDLPNNKQVQNIALFGLDSRSNNDSGRSDAIIILSIDRVHNKIKLTSIARDTYVAIEGRRNDKLTHAWAYGKAKLAVKTINQNFNMNITDYAYINFFEFTKLIDYLGGVMIDVSPAELNIMNNYYGPELRRLGFNYTNAKAGYVRLNGVQALAYSRNRYTGSDVDRGNRQKEVLEAMFSQVKDTSLTKFPSLISQVLEMVHTTLSNDELMSIARWALTAKPSFEQFGLPTAACNPQSGKNALINGVWYYIYDLDIATQQLHDFIYEEGAQTLGTTSKSRNPYYNTTTTKVTTTTSGTATTTTTTGDGTESTTSTDTDSTTDTTNESTTDPSGGDGSTTSTDADSTTSTEDGDTSTTTEDENTQSEPSSDSSNEGTDPTGNNSDSDMLL